MLVRLCHIRNSNTYIDSAFFSTLNDRRVLRKVKLIVYAIPYNLICGTEGMLPKAVKMRIFSVFQDMEHFRCFCRYGRTDTRYRRIYHKGCVGAV